MKSRTYLVAMAIVISFVSAQAQMTGGGAGTDNVKSGSSPSGGVLDKFLYMKFGFSSPRGTFAKKTAIHYLGA